MSSQCVCDRNRQLESKVAELEGEIEKHKKAARYIHGGERLPSHAASSHSPGEGGASYRGQPTQETFLFLRTSSPDTEEEIPGQWPHPPGLWPHPPTT